MNVHGAAILQKPRETHTFSGLGIHGSVDGIDQTVSAGALEPIAGNPLSIGLEFEVSSEKGFGSLDMHPLQDILPDHSDEDLSFRDWQLKCIETVSLNFVSKWQTEIATAWVFQETHNMRQVGRLSLVASIEWRQDEGLFDVAAWESNLGDDYLKVAAVGITIAAHTLRYEPERTTVSKMTLEDLDFDADSKVSQSPLVTIGESSQRSETDTPDIANSLHMFRTLMHQFDTLDRENPPLPSQENQSALWLKV